LTSIVQHVRAGRQEAQQQHHETKLAQDTQTGRLVQLAQRAAEVAKKIEDLTTLQKLGYQVLEAQSSYLQQTGRGVGTQIPFLREQAMTLRRLADVYERGAREAGLGTKEGKAMFQEAMRLRAQAFQREREVFEAPLQLYQTRGQMIQGYAQAVTQFGYYLTQFSEIQQTQIRNYDLQIKQVERLIAFYSDRDSKERIQYEYQRQQLIVQRELVKLQSEILQKYDDQLKILSTHERVYGTLRDMASQLQLPWTTQMELTKKSAEIVRQEVELSRAKYEELYAKFGATNQLVKDAFTTYIESYRKYVDTILYARRTLIEQMQAGFLGIGGTREGLLPVITPEAAWKGPAWFPGAITGTTEGRPLGVTWQDVMTKLFGSISEQKSLFEKMLVETQTGTVNTAGIKIASEATATNAEEIKTVLSKGITLQKTPWLDEFLVTLTSSSLNLTDALSILTDAVVENTAALSYTKGQIKESVEKVESEEARRKRWEEYSKKMAEAKAEAPSAWWTFWHWGQAAQRYGNVEINRVTTRDILGLLSGPLGTAASYGASWWNKANQSDSIKQISQSLKGATIQIALTPDGRWNLEGCIKAIMFEGVKYG